MSFFKVRSLFRLWDKMLWFKARAFQNESWNEGKGPGDSGSGQLNPFRVGIGREFLVDFGVEEDMVDTMCIT